MQVAASGELHFGHEEALALAVEPQGHYADDSAGLGLEWFQNEWAALLVARRRTIGAEMSAARGSSFARDKG